MNEHEECLHKLESGYQEPKRQRCFKCGRLGHIAKNCRSALYNSTSTKCNENRLEYFLETEGGDEAYFHIQ